MELARRLDKALSEAWIGHPYFDVIDNSTSFESKVKRMINVSQLVSTFHKFPNLESRIDFPGALADFRVSVSLFLLLLSRSNKFVAL